MEWTDNLKQESKTPVFYYWSVNLFTDNIKLVEKQVGLSALSKCLKIFFKGKDYSYAMCTCT